MQGGSVTSPGPLHILGLGSRNGRGVWRQHLPASGVLGVSPCLGAQGCSPDSEGAFLAQQDLHACLGVGATRGAFSSGREGWRGPAVLQAQVESIGHPPTPLWPHLLRPICPQALPQAPSPLLVLGRAGRAVGRGSALASLLLTARFISTNGRALG